MISNIGKSSSFPSGIAPPFPVKHLKGQPVFWDDFNSGPGGFIKQAGSLGDVITSSVNAIQLHNRWNWADGNEYSAYITSEASFWGNRSLKIGGSQTTYNTSASGDIGTQDTATMISVPSGIVGVEYMINFGNSGKQNISPRAFRHLLSIENTARVQTNPDRHELWIAIDPMATLTGLVGIFDSTGTITNILGVPSLSDSLGQKLFNCFSVDSNVWKGTDASWHRIALIADAVNGQYLDLWVDAFYFDLRSRGTGRWRTVSGAVSAPIPMQDGIFRVEFHAMKLTSGVAFDPYFYIDTVCITDEGA